MTPIYNYTGLANNTNMLDFFTVVNTSTNELLVGVILLIVAVVLFIGLKQFDTITALRTTGFITSLIAVLFFSIEMLSVEYMLIPIILTGVFLLVGFLTDR